MHPFADFLDTVRLMYAVKIMTLCIHLLIRQLITLYDWDIRPPQSLLRRFHILAVEVSDSNS